MHIHLNEVAYDKYGYIVDANGTRFDRKVQYEGIKHTLFMFELVQESYCCEILHLHEIKKDIAVLYNPNHEIIGFNTMLIDGSFYSMRVRYSDEIKRIRYLVLKIESKTLSMIPDFHLTLADSVAKIKRWIGYVKPHINRNAYADVTLVCD